MIKDKIIDGFLMGTGAIIAYLLVNSVMTKIGIWIIDRVGQ